MFSVRFHNLVRTRVRVRRRRNTFRLLRKNRLR